MVFEDKDQKAAAKMIVWLLAALIRMARGAGAGEASIEADRLVRIFEERADV
jgi:hypothetical protein